MDVVVCTVPSRCEASQGQTRLDLLRVSWEKRGKSDAVCPWNCDLPGRAFDSWEPATVPSFSRFSSTSWKRWLGDCCLWASHLAGGTSQIRCLRHPSQGLESYMVLLVVLPSVPENCTACVRECCGGYVYPSEINERICTHRYVSAWPAVWWWRVDQGLSTFNIRNHNFHCQTQYHHEHNNVERH